MNKLVLNSMVIYMIIIRIEKLELPNRKPSTYRYMMNYPVGQ